MGSLGGPGFGRLIKTIIPGLLLFSTLAGYIDEVARLRGRGHPVLVLARDHFPVLAGLAVPLGIVLGIFSNIVVFSWATDRLIRRPAQVDDGPLQAAEREVLDRTVDLKAPWLRDTPGLGDEHLDAEYLLAFEVKIDRLAYLQDSYWYYLEFQLNTALAVCLATPLAGMVAARFASWLAAPAWAAALLVGAVVGSALAVVRVLLSAARTNYRRHRVKRLSMLVAALHAAVVEAGDRAPEEEPGAGSPAPAPRRLWSGVRAAALRLAP